MHVNQLKNKRNTSRNVGRMFLKTEILTAVARKNFVFDFDDGGEYVSLKRWLAFARLVLLYSRTKNSSELIKYILVLLGFLVLIIIVALLYFCEELTS
jgi:hypothetical protein